MQAVINKEVVRDTSPCFATGQVSGLVQLEGGNSASVDRGGRGLGVGRGVGSI
jgi:hypothetical protein